MSANMRVRYTKADNELLAKTPWESCGTLLMQMMRKQGIVVYYGSAGTLGALVRGGTDAAGTLLAVLVLVPASLWASGSWVSQPDKYDGGGEEGYGVGDREALWPYRAITGGKGSPERSEGHGCGVVDVVDHSYFLHISVWAQLCYLKLR